MLEELGKQYGTDKVSHGFVNFYESLFSNIREETKLVLELGVLGGASIKMWKDYFPNATIYGMDNEEQSKLPDIKDDRIKLLKMCQLDRNNLNRFFDEIGTPFDIIIDDAGHYHNTQQITFGILFPRLKSKGFYCIEDLHTKNHPNYGLPIDHPHTTFHVLNNFKNSKKIDSPYIQENEKKYLEENIEEIKLHISEHYCQVLKNSITSCIIKK